VNHFGPTIAAHLRKRPPKPHATWHLDEVYLKIDGRMVYRWRAVEAEGEVLDVLVQSKRNKHAALKLMRKPHMSWWQSSGSFPGDQSPAVCPVSEVLSPFA
jgi:transposase-like protein